MKTTPLELYESPRTEVLEVQVQCLNNASAGIQDYNYQEEEDW